MVLFVVLFCVCWLCGVGDLLVFSFVVWSVVSEVSVLLFFVCLMVVRIL